jgi:hypothetical protein
MFDNVSKSCINVDPPHLYIKGWRSIILSQKKKKNDAGGRLSGDTSLGPFRCWFGLIFSRPSLVFCDKRRITSVGSVFWANYYAVLNESRFAPKTKHCMCFIIPIYNQSRNPKIEPAKLNKLDDNGRASEFCQRTFSCTTA